ncbi:UPF0489 family protein [Achromobacter sp. NCFB-sbj8-Ac1-l]|uniref:UPF0489 family protein n=1 Tax=unclassified Achromobacter TaxID=2626865 RepID=UPI004046F36D
MGTMMLTLDINNKSVFIFDSHQMALLPWSLLAKRAPRAPYVISLDYHTDTNEAFWNYAFWKCDQNTEKARTLCSELVDAIDRLDESSVQLAIENLKNDEHIDAAIKSGIISHSFSIQHMDSSGTLSNERKHYINRNYSDHMARLRNEILEPLPPFTYEAPKDKMFIVPRECAVGCERIPHNDECLRDYANQVLEYKFLREKFDVIDQMAHTSGIASIRPQPYILDIDLDYFQTLRAAKPKDFNFFHALIRNSFGITIAREHDCVDMLRFAGESIDSPQLERIVLQHIDKATC